MRYTEYHAGVAVIKDKNLLKEAMQKLAQLEDIEEKQELIRQLIKFCNKQETCDTRCTFYIDSHNCEFHDMTIEQLRDCCERIKQNKN